MLQAAISVAILAQVAGTLTAPPLSMAEQIDSSAKERNSDNQEPEIPASQPRWQEEQKDLVQSLFGVAAIPKSWDVAVHDLAQELDDCQGSDRGVA